MPPAATSDSAACGLADGTRGVTRCWKLVQGGHARPWSRTFCRSMVEMPYPSEPVRISEPILRTGTRRLGPARVATGSGGRLGRETTAVRERGGRTSAAEGGEIIKLI